jgi:nitrogen regulatory protein PII
MTMKIVTAFVRTTSLEEIVKSLQGIDVRSMTIEEIKGIGAGGQPR